MKIYLVGMPGSGKSTLGKELAQELMILFVDLDTEIERREGKSISEIFASKGEDYFRLVESQLLREWAGSDKSFVMATGGGAPCFLGGMETIKQTGVSIFIDVPLTELVKRLSEKVDRPLLNTANEAEKLTRLNLLRENRLFNYRQADIILDNPTLTSVLEAIHFKK